ncbi:MAG TPA: hypothetical protein VI248_07795, partial [Kineosporiaceae bacterium]
AMITDLEHLDTDEVILAAFADAGTDGLTLEQVTAACRPTDARLVARRFEVLRSYGAIAKVVDRPHERYHRAAFAPYVMLLFLRRMAAQGGQGEVHQLLTLEGIEVRSPAAGADDGRACVHRLVTVFRLMANQLAGLASASPVEELRENAELLWGNRGLIHQARQVHAAVLGRWPELDRECAALRTALAAYGDASDAAAARLIEQAGATRALGLLPVETWRTFARTADAEQLAAVLDGVLFDAPAPWFAPQDLVAALASSPQPAAARTPPPRPASDAAAVPVERPADDVAELRTLADDLLSGPGAVPVAELLDAPDGWTAARRVLARLTAAHHHPDVDAELAWDDGLRVDPTAGVPWVSGGVLRRPDVRTGATEAPAGERARSGGSGEVW